MRILLDTNILARATPGPPSLSRELVRLASRPPHVLILSPFLVSELTRVLGYDRIGLSVPDDPNDDPVIAAALAGQAEVLCTLDRHFWHPDVQAFCGQHGLRVRTDVQLVQELRSP